MVTQIFIWSHGNSCVPLVASGKAERTEITESAFGTGCAEERSDFSVISVISV